MLPALAAKDPLAALGGWRLRRLVLGSPGIRVDVRYAERATRRPLSSCPVCGAPIAPIRNRTLEGDRVVLGYRCTRCGYWTHLHRRTPVRYRFLAVGRDAPPSAEGPPRGRGGPTPPASS